MSRRTDIGDARRKIQIMMTFMDLKRIHSKKEKKKTHLNNNK